MIKELKEWRGKILDLLFPKICLGCGREGQWVCSECAKKVKPLAIYFCPACKKSLPWPGLCLDCRGGHSHLSGLWVLGDYNNPLLQKIIQGLKYDYLTELSDDLDDLMSRYFLPDRRWKSDYLLVSVPLHRRRELQRGYNQARLIAQALERVRGNKIIDGLICRRRYRRPQVGLPAGERRKNVQGIFAVNESVKNEYSGREIVLIDDVYTTGATMQECAKVLKRAGCGNIYGLVVASG